MPAQRTSKRRRVEQENGEHATNGKKVATESKVEETKTENGNMAQEPRFETLQLHAG